MSTRIIQFATGYQSAADVTGVLNADTIVFAPYLTIGAVNVQDAIEELKDELDAEVLVLEGADATLQSNINGVQSNLDAAEIALQAQITTNTSNISANTSAISGLGTSKQDASNAVTTDTNQTITGVKTFDTELIVKELATKPTAPSSTYKKIYAKDDGKVYTLNSDDEEVEVGSGAGGGSKNYVDNGSFDTNLVGWSTDDTDNFTIAAETVAPLAGTASLKITRVGAGTNVVTGTIAAIDEADVGTLIAAEAVVKLTGAAISTGDYTIEIHDGTDPVPGTVTDLQEGKHRYTFDFIPATGVTYSVVIRDDDGDDDDVLLVDEVRVGPNPAIIGGAGGWKQYVNTSSNGLTGDFVYSATPAGFVHTRSVIVPYKDPVTGVWRATINIVGAATTGTTMDVTITGIKFRKNQGLLSFPDGATIATRAVTNGTDGTSTIAIRHVSNNTAVIVSGDVELTAKPTWADFDGTVAMLTPSVLGENAEAELTITSGPTVATTATDIIYNNVLNISGISYNASTGVFTVEAAGRYVFAGRLTSSVSQTTWAVDVTDTSNTILRRIGRGVTQFGTLSGGLRFTKGSQFKIRANGSTGGALGTSPIDNWLTINRIADRSSRGALGFGLATSTAAGLISAYDEGTFSPTFVNSSGNTVHTAAYTRIANRAYFDIEITGSAGSPASQLSWNWPLVDLPDVRDAARLHGGIITDLSGSTFIITLRWDLANKRWDFFSTTSGTTSVFNGNSWAASRIWTAQFSLPIVGW